MARQGEGRQAKTKTPKTEPAILASGVMTSAEANGGRKNGKDTSELHEFLYALQAMRAGDFSVCMPSDFDGIAGKIADTFNEIVTANHRMAQELERAGEIVGREGKTRHRVKFGLSSGA